MVVKAIFSDAALGLGIVGNYFIAIARNSVIPSGWDKMDGGFVPGGGMATFPALHGAYLRGSQVAAIGNKGGNRTHDHLYVLSRSATDVMLPAVQAVRHFVGVSGARAIAHSLAGNPLISVSTKIHTHAAVNPATWNSHIHNMTVDTDAQSLLPKSFGIDWIGKILSRKELDAFPKGSVLGIWDDRGAGNVFIPTGWVLCTGIQNTPNCISKFPSPGGGGAADHQHTGFLPSNTGTTEGGHGHAPSFTSTNGSIGFATSGGNPNTVNTFPHIHSPFDSIGGHDHDIPGTVTGPSLSNLPDFINIPFIMKIADQSEPNTFIPSSLHMFFFSGFPAAPSVPVGFSATTFANGLLLYGRKVADSDFGSLGGPFFDDTHTHSLNVQFSTSGNHNHNGSIDADTLANECQSLRMISGATLFAACGHNHTITTTDAGSHSHLDVPVSLLGNHKPETIDLSIVQKTP